MSGVLDRMVQRVRGGLPAVEPLVAPQRTPLAALPSRVDEALQRDATRPSVEMSDIAPMPLPASRPGANEGAPTGAQVQGRRPNREKPQLEREPTRHLPNRSVDGEPVVTAGPATAMAQPVPGEPQLHVLEVRTVSAPGTEPEPPTAETREPTALLPPARKDLQPQRREPSSEVKSAPRTPEPAPHATPGMEVAAENTEIHITIGSIELRAPHTEATAPAFRPRVTLDEFLSRKPGAGS